MGTRGIMGFAIEGEERLAYNHYDSYPESLGVDMLNWATGVTRAEGWDAVKEQARALRYVETDKPTPEELKALRFTHDPKVSEGNDWYAALRDTQGDPAKTLAVGLMEDGHEFAQDSLFCEWGYVVDLDHMRLEVYRGFQHEPHSEGRFAGGPGYDAGGTGGGHYEPIKLVGAWSLTEPPSEQEFLEALREPEEVEA